MHPEYALSNAPTVFSPSLVFFPALIRGTIARVIHLLHTRWTSSRRNKWAASPTPLRPHVKTHKTRETPRMLLDAGVTRHKCATIAEAEMLATAGAPDVLIAYPLVGPNLGRLVELV